MEFWGVEVKPNESLKVAVEDFKLLHISQVALGEVKNGKKVENVSVRVNINDKKYVVGTLSSERAPQIMFDLVFEQDLELSHGWKDGSVYFCGYIADNPVEDDGVDFDSSDDEEALNFNAKEAVPAKPKAEVKDAKEEDESDSDSEEEDDSEEDDSDEEEDSEEEKQVLEKVKPFKKRQAEASIKTPVPSKKAKANSPQQTGWKKGGHTATPHPSSKPNSKKGKKAGK